MESQQRQFLIGLPAHGKTTFLAALWYVLSTKEVATSLEFARLSSENKHLNKIADLWANVQPVKRTLLGEEKYVSMFLRVPGSCHETEIIFPDLSGESFVDQWKNRQMKPEHAELIREAVGGLLLIHPDEVMEDDWIPDILPIADSIIHDEEPGSSTSVLGLSGPLDTPENPTTLGWDPYKTPTQIQLVDLLQFVAELNERRPIRLAVVVSAWDRVVDTKSPDLWLERYVPLLWQYLKSNPETFASEFYGVSAQGGCLKDADQLRKIPCPSHRIRVVRSGDPESSDITAPARWVMG